MCAWLRYTGAMRSFVWGESNSSVWNRPCTCGDAREFTCGARAAVPNSAAAPTAHTRPLDAMKRAALPIVLDPEEELEAQLRRRLVGPPPKKEASSA